MAKGNGRRSRNGAGAAGRPTGAIALLKQDHRAVDDLFEQFEGLSDRAVKKAITLRDRITKELALHTSIEENVLYPAVLELAPELEDDILEGVQEHLLAKQLLVEVQELGPDDEWFKPKMTVLIESVRHHVEDEEEELFPQLKKQLDKEQLREIGRLLGEAKRSATQDVARGTLATPAVDALKHRADPFIAQLQPS